MLVHRYIFLTCRWSGSIRGPLGWELGVLTSALWWPKLKNIPGNPLYNNSMTLGAIYWQKRQSRVNHGRNTVAETELDFINFPIPRELRSTRMQINHGQNTVAKSVRSFTFATIFRMNQNSQDKIELRIHYGSFKKYDLLRLLPYLNELKQSRQNRITAPLRFVLIITMFYVCYRISTGLKQSRQNRIITPLRLV
jgi:hypothetical protein